MPIIDLSDTDPLTDGRQSPRALAVRRGVVRHFQQLGLSLVPELPLATGRRADLVGLDRKGRFIIIEIKSSVEDFRADSKWPDYLVHCDRFYFATHPEVPREIFPEEQGLIIADHYGAEMIRDSLAFGMAGATRKALMTRFARLAANRLERISAHLEARGETIPRSLLSDDGDG